MGKADLHIHTAFGDGMAEIPELFDYVEGQTDLTAIAVTDHDDVTAGLRAREIWAKGRWRFEVIVGAEITTLDGHLVGLFLEEQVPSLQKLAPTLEAVHEQGGLCAVPHPGNLLTRSVSHRMIEKVLREGSGGAYFDGIDLSANGFGSSIAAGKARRLNAERYHLAAVCGSDAHFLPVVGSSYTTYDGAGADDLRRAILERKTGAGSVPYPNILQIGVGKVMRQSYRGILATPRRMGWNRTIRSFLRINGR